MAAAATKKPDWTMPAWMEPYRESFDNTGGNTVEGLINALSERGLYRSNQVLWTLAITAESQVKLLYKLHADGKLLA